MRPRRLAALVAVPAALLIAVPAQAITNPQIPGLQVALKAKGFYRGEIDGIAGPQTAKAVRRFQRDAGLVVDGVAGPQTRTALGRLGRPLFGRRMIITRGMVGWDVSVLEFFLTRRGFSSGQIDGRFTHATQRALRRYQRMKGLAVDGIAGPQTLRTLGARQGKRGRGARLASSRRSVNDAIAYWSARYGVDVNLVRGLAWMESGFQPNVVSPVGARGVMQITPVAWRYAERYLIGHRVRHTADGNVHIGVAFLHQLLKMFHGRERLAIGAYYQGAASVRQHGLFVETRRFVADVLALKRRFSV